MSVRIGNRAPDFELPNQLGFQTRLYDLIGAKNIVLFFYPKDDSPGCTREACAFRDSYLESCMVYRKLWGLCLAELPW